MAEQENAELTNEDVREEQLKQALWLAVGRLVDDACMALDSNATPQFIAALTESVWAQIETAAVDVETFARHAGRDVVNIADVMLLARRNEVLSQLVKSRLDTIRVQHDTSIEIMSTESGAGKGKRKAR